MHSDRNNSEKVLINSQDTFTKKSFSKEFLSLFFPIVIILLSGSLAGSFERICLARYSLEALNATVQALCALQFFQMTCIVFANMTQIFVGEKLGLNKDSEIGKYVWQMIWLSLLSVVLIIPLSFVIDPLFFKGTEHRKIANDYFTILLFGNFLFPLGAVLSSFFLAQGKRGVIIWSSLGAFGVNFVLNLLLILGLFDVFSPLGSIGAAWSGLVAKSFFCIVLFLCFLNRFNRRRYHTFLWKMNFSSMLFCLRICTPRAIGKAFAILIWTATTYLMIKKEGNYLSVLSIGSTLILFCSFLSEGLVQSLSVIFSRYLGSKDFFTLWKSWRLGFFFAFLVCIFLAIPFLFFPNLILSLFFSELPQGMQKQLLQSTIKWIWFWVFFNSLNAPLLAFLLAAQDTVFYMILMSLTWLTSCLPIYYCLYHLDWTADKFWFVLVFDQLVVFALNSWRVRLLQAKILKESISSLLSNS